MTDPPPRRGDKFAALQQQQQKPTAAPPKRDKFAALQSRVDTTAPAISWQPQAPPEEDSAKQKQSAAASLKKQKFVNMWNDLQLAEAATLRLLQLARDTAESLANADTLDAAPASPPVDDFLSTLQDIHTRLSPHAPLVKTYQAPTEPNKTYLAKVELGMARQKRNLIQAWNKIMIQEQAGEEENMAAVPIADSSEATVGSKRKRDDGSN